MSGVCLFEVEKCGCERFKFREKEVAPHTLRSVYVPNQDPTNPIGLNWTQDRSCCTFGKDTGNNFFKSSLETC